MREISPFHFFNTNHQQNDPFLNAVKHLKEMLDRATEEAHADTLRLRQMKYNSNQPRVPAGSSDGGQWSGDNSGNASPSGRNDTVRGYHTYTSSPDKFPGGDIVDKPLSKPLNVNRAAQTLKEHLRDPKLGPATCARNVRIALSAGDIDVTPPPARPGASAPWARDYGLPLEAAGFQRVAKNSSLGTYPPIGYVPQSGDVAVIQPTSDPKHPEGHMQMYIGRGGTSALTDIEPPDHSSGWLSYFKQPDFWPGPGYRQDRPNYIIYRHVSQSE